MRHFTVLFIHLRETERESEQEGESDADPTLSSEPGKGPNPRLQDHDLSQNQESGA